MKPVTKKSRDVTLQNALESFSYSEEFTARDVADRSGGYGVQGYVLSSLQVSSLLRGREDVVRVGTSIPAIYKRVNHAKTEVDSKEEFERLRPCPFCGSEDVTSEFHFSEMIVRCPRCECRCSFEVDVRKYGRRENAIKRWNSRWNVIVRK